MEISGPVIGIISFALVILFSMIGIPIAFGTAVVGIGGMIYMRSWETALSFSGITPFAAASHYTLSVLPLFILMGYLVAETGATTEFYNAAKRWLGKLPGGLALSTVVGSAAFAACTGSSASTAALFGTVAYPEMREHGYDRRLSLGSVCCSAPLAVMIPPSALLVMYAIMIEGSVSRQLLAGFLPGLLTAFLFMLMIFFRVWRNPSIAPSTAGFTWKEKFESLKGVWATLGIIIIIIGGLYLGLVTPTEAGALGVFTAFVIGVARKRMSWAVLKRAMINSAKTNCMIFTIIVGVFLYISFLAITNLPYAIGEWIVALNVPGLVIIAGIMLLCILLGMFMDAIGILMLVVPITFKTVLALGFNPVWYGVLLIHTCEMGLITPPVGLTAFALKGVLPNVPMEEIFRSIAPFLLMLFITLAILMLFPDITLLLPNTMR
ncbi:TRAP transporter large permease [Chloroflexota bacterium]